MQKARMESSVIEPNSYCFAIAFNLGLMGALKVAVYSQRSSFDFCGLAESLPARVLPAKDDQDAPAALPCAVTSLLTIVTLSGDIRLRLS